jgi:hypothetical protein
MFRWFGWLSYVRFLGATACVELGHLRTGGLSCREGVQRGEGFPRGEELPCREGLPRAGLPYVVECADEQCAEKYEESDVCESMECFHDEFKVIASCGR